MESMHNPTSPNKFIDLTVHRGSGNRKPSSEKRRGCGNRRGWVPTTFSATKPYRTRGSGNRTPSSEKGNSNIKKEEKDI
jgi:hypothetical protein